MRISLSTRPEAGWLQAALKAIRGSRVTVFGDYCLDVYWMIEAGSEVSLETGLPVHNVTGVRCSPT